MLMTAYTLSQPGALIESSCIHSSNDALHYRDVVLRILLNLEEPEHHMLMMEVSLKFMKGKWKIRSVCWTWNEALSTRTRVLTRDRTTYIFHEQDDNLALCPILNFLALAFTDDAFDSGQIQLVEDIFWVYVPLYCKSLKIQWKPQRLDVPVFCRADCMLFGACSSPDCVLQYNAFNQLCQQLGCYAGLEDPLTPYCIRRGTAGAVDDIDRPSELTILQIEKVAVAMIQTTDTTLALNQTPSSLLPVFQL